LFYLSSELSVGDLEITPVSAAIACYLGIDLSVEGKAARNRRGICIIVHGAPLSGKSATSIDLARRYRTALVTIDGVVEQAIVEGKSSAGMFVLKVILYTSPVYFLLGAYSIFSLATTRQGGGYLLEGSLSSCFEI